MTTRGFFTVLAATATAGAAYFALMPTYTEVPTSVLPDAILETVDISVGGPIGISVDPGSATARFDCGSPVSPVEIRFSNSNVLSDFLDQAERIESRVQSGCDRTHDRRWQLVVVALIGAGMLLGLGLVSGRRPSTSRPASPSAPPPGPSSTLPIPPSAEPNGPPLVPPRWGTPPTSPPTSPPISGPSAGPPDAGESAPVVTPSRRKQIVGATAAGLVVMAVVGGVVGIDRGAPRVAFPGLPATAIDPALVSARQCATAAFESIDSGYDRTQASSTADLDESIINLDGDASWQRYSDALRALDVDECSAEFRTTVVELANAWGSFGDDWLGSTKGLSSERLSDDDLQRHATRINAAMQLLEDLASDIDLEVRHVAYTFN